MWRQHDPRTLMENSRWRWWKRLKRGHLIHLLDAGAKAAPGKYWRPSIDQKNCPIDLNKSEKSLLSQSRLKSEGQLCRLFKRVTESRFKKWPRCSSNPKRWFALLILHSRFCDSFERNCDFLSITQDFFLHRWKLKERFKLQNVWSSHVESILAACRYRLASCYIFG